MLVRWALILGQVFQILYPWSEIYGIWLQVFGLIEYVIHFQWISSERKIVTSNKLSWKMKITLTSN